MINEFEVEFEGIVLGTPPFCKITYEGMGSPELRVVESELPGEDGIAFGQEFFGARKMTLNGAVKEGNPNTPSSAEDVAAAWNTLSTLIEAWDGWQNDRRKRDREVTKLVFRRPGRADEFYAYGRPERIDPELGLAYTGFIPWSAQFRQADRKFYSATEQVLGIMLSQPNTGGLVLSNPPDDLGNYITNPNVQSASGTIVLDTNLVTNPSVETDTVGYAAITNKQQAAVSGDAFVGSWNLRSTTVGATGHSDTWATYNVTLPVAGTYVVGAHMKSATLNTRVASNFTGATVITAANVVASGANWTRSTQVISASAGGVTGNVMVQSTTTPAASGQIVNVDGLSVVAEPIVSTYFDGTTTDDATYIFDWTGTPHASTSTRSGHGLAAWTSADGKVYRKDGTSGEVRATAAAPVRVIATDTLAVTAEEMVTGFVETLTGPRTAQVGIQWLDSGGTPVNVSYIRTAATPSTAAFARVIIDYAAGAAWDISGWDLGQLTKGEYTGDYFDGDTTDDTSFDYRWEGAAHASISRANDQFPGILTPFTTTAPTFRLGAFTQGGTTSSWAIVKFTGPCLNPELRLLDSNGETLWRLRLLTKLKTGQTVTIDPRPWKRTALRSDGGNLAGVMRGPAMNQMTVPVGDGEFVYLGQDATGESTCEVRFRNAWVSI